MEGSCANAAPLSKTVCSLVPTSCFILMNSVVKKNTPRQAFLSDLDQPGGPVTGDPKTRQIAAPVCIVASGNVCGVSKRCTGSHCHCH